MEPPHALTQIDKETGRMCYTCEKKTYNQYVEMFKENNPRIIQSIANYWNQHKEEYGEDKAGNRGFTEESNESNNNNVDCNFNYKNTLQ